MMSREPSLRIVPGPHPSDAGLELERLTSLILHELRKEVRQIEGCFRSLAEECTGGLVPPAPQAEV